ncbi:MULTISPECIES: hypothetical protein [unclassified Spirosoma]|uniref:hypothetical protein n=1 Tax=unclassified Spirosoma TaxID=2621999 RepID=UPI00095FDF66|nr:MULTISPECIES: hypothetical protein [unclassified Spirosoma]MBN8821238.1 hypothetical protein [Spirosoma sp.]OJW79136.1 MAG: hypothetical protein BGO59_11335 [Spirosoma sp. 48-14]
MIIDQFTIATHHNLLTDIHTNGVFIGVLNKPDLRINLLYWNRFLVEIHCQFIGQEWEPVKVNYQLRTEVYMDLLMSSLTQQQVCKLRDAIHSQETN